MVRLGGFGGSVWVMGEWPVGQWIVGVISFQKMYGFYGLKYHIVDIIRDVMRDVRTSEYSATQLLICEKLSLAKMLFSGLWPLEAGRGGWKPMCSLKSSKCNSLCDLIL